MRSSGIKTWFIILLSLAIAVLLSILPLPDWANWFRPRWVVLVVIYWALALPYRVGVGVAWIIGLFLDVLYGTLLGQHALAMTVMAFIAVKFRQRILLFPLSQQLLIMFTLILLYQLILFLIQGFLGQVPMTWRYWATPFTSALFWPWIFGILYACQRRFKILDATDRSFIYSRD